MSVKTIKLYYQDGTSDKVYILSIEKIQNVANGKSVCYDVTYEYGRRGGELKRGVKNEKPVTLEEANIIYDKLLKEKTKKGYEEKDEDDGEKHDVYVVKELIDEENYSELDFELQEEFGFKYDDFDSRFEIIQRKSGTAEDANPIKIEILIDRLKEMQKMGATHVQIEDHCDHIGYDISAWKMTKATKAEIDELMNKEKKKKKKNEEINKLQSRINELQNEED